MSLILISIYIIIQLDFSKISTTVDFQFNTSANIMVKQSLDEINDMIERAKVIEIFVLKIKENILMLRFVIEI